MLFIRYFLQLVIKFTNLMHIL